MLAAVLLAGCTEESVLSPDSTLVVVRGYLYADEPVSQIQLTQTLSLGSSDSTAPPVNDAEVALFKGNARYDLVPSPGDSGYYYYPGDGLTVRAGDEFSIEVVYGDQVITAETVVPPPPGNVTLSKERLSFPDFDTLWELRQQGVGMDSIRAMMTLTVSWEGEQDALYYVVVENLEDDPKAVESQFMRGSMRFISRPFSGDQYAINANMMSHFGRHEAVVYRVNQEYADLYQSRNQDSRDLNEPLTNIENGLGVFSAFNSGRAEFYFSE